MASTTIENPDSNIDTPNPVSEKSPWTRAGELVEAGGSGLITAWIFEMGGIFPAVLVAAGFVGMKAIGTKSEIILNNLPFFKQREPAGGMDSSTPRNQ